MDSIKQSTDLAKEKAVHRLELWRAYLEYMRNMGTVAVFTAAAVLEFRTKILFKTDTLNNIATAALFLISLIGAIFAAGIFLQTMTALIRKDVTYARLWLAVGFISMGFCTYLVSWIAVVTIIHPARPG